MVFKVNYGLERAERNRAKQAKKEAKAQARKTQAEAPPEAADDAADAPLLPASAKPEAQ